jgi:hypothetical protein
MMAKIIYKGLADVRVLNAGDVKVDGFEPTSFRRHEPTEVSDAVAEAILSKPRTYGRFIVAREAPAEATKAGVEAPADKPAATSSKKP